MGGGEVTFPMNDDKSKVISIHSRKCKGPFILKETNFFSGLKETSKLHYKINLAFVVGKITVYSENFSNTDIFSACKPLVRMICVGNVCVRKGTCTWP